MALSFSGRLRVTVATRFSTAYSTVSAMSGDITAGAAHGDPERHPVRSRRAGAAHPTGDGTSGWVAVNARAGQTDAVQFDLDQVDALLSTTRAVRKRLDFDKPVPDDVLLECLQLAVQAPTGSNRQSWRWLVVRDQAKKDALADLYLRAGGDYLRTAAQEAEAPA